jgi:hypothetical protein
MLGFDGIGSVRGPSNIYNLQYFFLDRHVMNLFCFISMME